MGKWIKSLIGLIWRGEGLLGCLFWILLIPLSFLYSFVVQVRNALFWFHWMPTEDLPRTVVSVGNITVGGTGKTPTTLWLAEELAGRGHKVAILSRGYKRIGSDPTILEPGSNRSITMENYDTLYGGDEPVMMAATHGWRVGVGKRRGEVGSLMLQESEVDVFLLDDGFQHRRLRRDLDLVLLGSDYRGWVLPAGPFREPRSALCRADSCLITGSREKWKSLLARGKRGPNLLFGSLEARGLLRKNRECWEEVSLSLLTGAKVLAVCAIAKPAPFYRKIQEWGGEIVDIAEFPDHHSYSIKDWREINRVARNADHIVTTEKDIVKLAQFPFANERLFALRVAMVVEEGETLIQSVEKMIREKSESSADSRGTDG